MRKRGFCFAEEVAAAFSLAPEGVAAFSEDGWAAFRANVRNQVFTGTRERGHLHRIAVAVAAAAAYAEVAIDRVADNLYPRALRVEKILAVIRGDMKVLNQVSVSAR
jgi:hypothetical protein